MQDLHQNPYAPPSAADSKHEHSEFAACPSCNCPYAKRVSWTVWGGMLGPKMLTHVKCQQCGVAYNGKTGRSNATAIAIYVVVCLALGLALGIGFSLMAIIV